MILNGAENGKHTGMILIDLQKAFDTSDHKILLDKMKCRGFSDKTMVSLSSHKQSYFCFVWHYLLRSSDHKLRSSPRTYIGTFVGFAIHKWYFNIRTLWNSKMFRIKNLQMYAIGLLIISYQFILVKIKQNAFLQ